jgi:asparagine synthase (glutamine-hydrolysing)
MDSSTRIRTGTTRGDGPPPLGTRFDRGPLTLDLDCRLYNPEDFGDRRMPAGDLLLEAIERDGLEPVLARIVGDFALALRDDRDGSVRLARDRFGIRPLYHSRLGASAEPFWAARPLDLVARSGRTRGVSAALRRDHVACLGAANYRFFNTDPLRTPFRDVEQVPAGTVVSFRGGAVTRHPYARFGEVARAGYHQGDVDDLAERYLALLRDAVERRLRWAGSAGFSLSGGLDSSAVVALSAAALGRPCQAYSSVHGGGLYDETSEIRDILDAGLAEWSPVPVHAPDVATLLPRLIEIHGEPVPTVTWLNHHVLCGAVKAAGHDAVFGGLGGDEQHAGEYDYFFYLFADLAAAGETTRLADEIALWQRHHDHPIHRKTPDVAREGSARLTDPSHPGRCVANRHALLRYADAISPDFFDLDRIGVDYEATIESYLGSHSVNELLRNTMPCCLRASDHNAAHAGLADIHPFLDHRLLEFMLAIPPEMKIRGGVTKWFARRAYRGLLPEATRTRIVKTGWNAPAHRWFAEDLREMLIDTLGSRRARERGIFDTTRLIHYMDEHREIVSSEGPPRDNHMMLLWQALNLELWLQHLERETGTAASFE